MLIYIIVSLHAAVSPKWVVEPVDSAVLAGEPLVLHCHTTGSPTPQLTWLKQRGKTLGFSSRMSHL